MAGLTMDEDISNPRQTWVREECSKPGFLNSTLHLLSLTGLFVQECRGIFSKPIKHVPGLEELRWVPDPDDPDGIDIQNNRIMIDSADRAQDRIAGFKPGIIVKRKGRTLLDDKALQSSSYTGMTVNGNKEHVRWWGGQYELAVTGATRGSVEVIADYLAEYWMQFGPVIAKEFRLWRLEVKEVSEAFILEEEKTMWCVVVTIEYAYNVSWELGQMRPRYSGTAVIVD